jgi:DNA-directed RNA polymerase sigma subunit (sigma70/sigma32)
MSEAYIVLTKAVPLVDVTKIKNPEAWKFMHFYKRRLEWKNSYFNTFVEQKNNSTFSYYDTSTQQSETVDITAFVDAINHTSADLVPTQVINSLCMEKFVNNLNPQEYRVLQHYFTKGNYNKTPTLAEIGERMGLTKQRIGAIVQEMKKKWKVLEKVEEC